MSNITISNQPSKTVYFIGEILDITGLKVWASYSDGTGMEVPITENDISGFNSSTAGDKTLTITYENLTATITVSVIGDHTQWDTVTNTTFTASETILDIAWGNGKFVAVGGMYPNGSSGKIAYSNDGITWNAVNSLIFTSCLEGVIWGNNKFVAVGRSGTIAYSADGIMWTKVESSLFGSSSFVDVAYGSNRFVAVGQDNKIIHSTDGISWVAVTDSPFQNMIFSVVSNGSSRFVATGLSSVAYSIDGSSWNISSHNFASNLTIAAVGYGKDIFLVGTESGALLRSTNGGISWTGSSNPFLTTSTAIFDFAFGDNQFIAVGEYVNVNRPGRIAYSVDGITWISISDTTFNSGGIMGATYGNGKFVAVGSNGKMAYSVAK